MYQQISFMSDNIEGLDKMVNDWFMENPTIKIYAITPFYTTNNEGKLVYFCQVILYSS